ncbi:helix-turn-helix transcriptional regulator [Lentibacillus cibarius]|uniref:Helix-turn-helix transcriptional regulator n=1 Tax=Lentibacillus cibarius TaxID=2583219 RepID=A0A549YG82_9BACI|nr:helix-turn-helix transcriptional regulator [Lentibacillus cibarius]TRM10894.1 helix-turn-helix transcriptional regulator [Lentibacillus cibarius]
MGTVGDKLHYYRKKRGLSRKDLVDGVCDESTLFRIEKENHLPNIYLVEQLCRKYVYNLAFTMR